MPSTVPYRRVIINASADAISQCLKRNGRRTVFGKQRAQVGVLFYVRELIPPAHYCPCVSIYIGADTVQVYVVGSDKRMKVLCDQYGILWEYRHDSGEIIEGASKRKGRELLATFWEKR